MISKKMKMGILGLVLALSMTGCGMSKKQMNEAKEVVNKMVEASENCTVTQMDCSTELVTKVKKCNADSKTVVYGLENAYGYGRALAVWLIDKGYLVKDVNTAISHRQAKHCGVMYRKSDSDDAEAIALATLNMLSGMMPRETWFTVPWTES